MQEKPWYKNYDEGVPTHLDYPKVPLYRLLEDAAKKCPEKTCTIFHDSVIQYHEMNELTDRLAGAIAALDVHKGDRVGILMPNIPQFVIAYFGILKAGGVVVAINPLYTPREIEYEVKDAGVKLMIVMSDYYDSIRNIQPRTSIRNIIVTHINDLSPRFSGIFSKLDKENEIGIKVQLSERDFWLMELLKKHSPIERPKIEITDEDVAIFQYSGGTTGIPKGAIALHRNLIANSLEFREWMHIRKDGNEVVLIAIPLFHVYGMVVGMCLAIASGASMVLISDPRDIDNILESIQKYSVTIYPGVPTMYVAINNHPDVIAGKYNLKTIKACISGSAPLMQETKIKFEQLTGGKLVEGYGLSEAPTATHCNPLYKKNPPGSIGLPLPDIDAKIISLEDEVTEVPPLEVGELVISGPLVFKEYHNMPTETEYTLRNGWLYTGDIARMDEEGFFYILDRKKELIKPAGYQVWPREVEEIISAHPNVFEVGVAGVPDYYRGETVKAWIVPKPGETLTEQEIKDWCKERLANYKIPTQIEFRQGLPKSNVGKILRRELVREHQENE